MGQGHLSTFLPVIAARLGIDPAAVRLVQGDSDLVPAGTPSVASRSMMMAGSAAALACDGAVDKGRRVAAHLLRGRARPTWSSPPAASASRGTDRAIGLLDLAAAPARCRAARGPRGRPRHHRQVRLAPDELPQRLPRHRGRDRPGDRPGGGVGYAAVDDVGHMVHETIVEGQIHGGIAQGLGQVLGEHVVYDDDGQLLTGSFMDYFMPRADDLPTCSALTTWCHADQSARRERCGESGVAGVPAFGVSAVLDALRHGASPISTCR